MLLLSILHFAPIACGGLCSFLVPFYSFAIFSLRKRKLLALFLLMSCGCYCSVSLPHDVVGWSVVYTCGIFWSYSPFATWWMLLLVVPIRTNLPTKVKEYYIIYD